MAGFSLIPPRAREFAALAQLVEAFHPDTQPEEWNPEHQAVAEAAAILLLPYVRRVEERERQAVAAGRPKAPKRKREPHALQKARPVVYARSGGFCEANTPGCPPGRHQATHVHHKRGRNAAADHAPARLLHVCREGHEWIHAHPEASYLKGWLERRLGAS